MDDLIWFHGYSFDAKNGELIRRDEEGNETVNRIAPQPAKLLWLLLDHEPDVVSHEQIRDRIWPEVEVDYEGSIHFCIRQIRSALNDSAADPKFVETIPRRGYRWIGGIEEQPKTYRQRTAVPPGSWFALKGIVVILSILALVFLGKKLMQNGQPETSLETSTQTIRLGIMPFVPNDSANPWTGNSIGYQLLESMTNLHETEPRAAGFEIIGPTTTSGFGQQKIREMSKELQLDAVLNGRFLGPDKDFNLLVEIIRSSDGAHIWVRSYVPDVDRDKLVREATKGTLEAYGSKLNK